MLVDITNDGSCSKGDVIKAKYLYDGKYLLLHKYNDLDEVSIDMQCYEHQCVELQDKSEIDFYLKKQIRIKK